MTSDEIDSLKKEFDRLYPDAAYSIKRRKDHYHLLACTLWEGFKAGYAFSKTRQALENVSKDYIPGGPGCTS